MDKVDVDELLDTITDARKYLANLNLLNKELNIAEKQIQSSAELAEKEIENTFGELIFNLTKALQSRKEKLIQNARKIRDSSLVPLQSSQLLISDKLQETNKLIELSKQIESFNVAEFTKKSSKLGSLPEVPELKEVSFISFQFDSKVQCQLLESCVNFGTISRIAPAQICSLTAKPGAILVEWEILDSDEPYAEVQEYQLQKAFGNAANNTNVIFYDCYKGAELQYLAQDLSPNQDYSFRVRCKFEGCNDYSPWSIDQISNTSIKPYSWLTNPHFKLSNEFKIATPATDFASTVLSDGPQFSVGNTIDFTFVDVGDCLKENYIGLIYLEDSQDGFNLNTCKEGTFLFETSGNIYIDGSVKSTKLPPVQSGSKVSFMCTAINDDKIRMNIDVSDKRVTYDWNMENSQPMHFVAKFNSSKWKVLVE